MAKINNRGNNRCDKVSEKGRTLLTLLVEKQIATATLDNSIRVHKKLKIELPYNPAIALLGIYPKDTKCWFEWVHAPIVYSIINISQTMERAQVSIDWWMDKEDKEVDKE